MRQNWMKHGLHWVLLIVSSLALWGAALQLGANAQNDELAVHNVDVYHNRFEPAELTINAGETVRFLNLEAMPEGDPGHVLTTDDGSIASPELDKDDTWEHTFDQTGTHHFAIKGHHWAPTGIIVTVSSTSTATSLPE